MTAPLAGIRVVEIASFVAAPAGGALLADLGAEVIKVEVPQGEIYRYSTPRVSGFKSDFPEAARFHMDNRGKRSLTLDVTREAARNALRRVIDRADIVITNMLPQRQEKYGIDAETLRADRPALIFASMSGYGPLGPDSREPAFDYSAYWARTGFMNTMRDEGMPPAFLRPGTGDHAAALALVTGILSALRMRDKTGQGQVVDVNLMHMGFYVQGNDAADALATGQSPPNHDRDRPRNPLWNHYPTKDERWLFLVMIESDRYWQTLCKAIERVDLLGDERNEGPVGRYRNSEALTAAIAATMASRTLEEWEAVFARHRIIWAPVRTLLEGTRDPQAHAIGAFAEVDHPTGKLRTVAPPIRMSDHAMPGTAPAPDLGADSGDVLRQAGLDDAAIASALGREGDPQA
jgi:crotonobetainyl-CoA:carnitine CoA-transferase CaiB-like acyl-CoA transferase